jgi:TrmH family RNA methyltransferase
MKTSKHKASHIPTGSDEMTTSGQDPAGTGSAQDDEPRVGAAAMTGPAGDTADDALMRKFRIVLVEPQGSLNVGATCRAMKNFGLTDLRLVRPGCSIDSDARKMALHAVSILETARVSDTIGEAVAGSVLVLGTANRRGQYHEPNMTVREGLGRIGRAIPQGPVSILFGREEWGLTKEDLEHTQGTIRIAAHPEFTSLNLAQAVLLIGYELYQAFGNPKVLPKAQADDPFEQPPSFEELQRLFAHMHKVLLMCEFLPRTNPDDLFQVIRTFFSRSEPNRREINILMGIFSNVHGFMRKFVGAGKGTISRPNRRDPGSKVPPKP